MAYTVRWLNVTETGRRSNNSQRGHQVGGLVVQHYHASPVTFLRCECGTAYSEAFLVWELGRLLLMSQPDGKLNGLQAWIDLDQLFVSILAGVQ